MTHQERLADLRARFVADVEPRLDEIEARLNAGDTDGARRLAHNLKGTAASLGVALHVDAEALERVLREAGVEKAAAIIARIRISLEKAADGN